MISIRNYLNSDTPDIVRLWNSHREAIGFDPHLNESTVEIVVLGRPYFGRHHLLVAESDGQLVGFLHWLPLPGASGEAVIANLAVPPATQRREIALALIDQAFQAAQLSGVHRLLIGQAPEHWTGYAGVGRCGLGNGVPENEPNVIRWSEESGFKPSRNLSTFNLHLPTYRPPFDRELLAMRRVASVTRYRDITDQPFRIASALSHLEMHRFLSTDRGGGQFAQVDVLMSDPELGVVSGNDVLIAGWTYTGTDPQRESASLRYALTGVVSELAAERAMVVQTTIESDDFDSSQLLEAVGFTLHQRGTVYVRDLH